MDDFDFDETLTLRGPLALPPPRAGGPRTHLYFSTLDRGGKDVIVCVAVAVPIGSKSPLHADGTRAHVIGSGRAVRATLMVAAKCVLPLSCDPRVVEECQPSLLWAALILGGVVSSANLVTSQPSLTLASISVHRQPGVARAAVHIMCTVDVPAAAVQEVAIVASVVSYTDDSLSVEVSDVNTCAPDAAPGFLATLLLFVHWYDANTRPAYRALMRTQAWNSIAHCTQRVNFANCFYARSAATVPILSVLRRRRVPCWQPPPGDHLGSTRGTVTASPRFSHHSAHILRRGTRSRPLGGCASHTSSSNAVAPRLQ